MPVSRPRCAGTGVVVSSPEAECWRDWVRYRLRVRDPLGVCLRGSGLIHADNPQGRTADDSIQELIAEIQRKVARCAGGSPTRLGSCTFLPSGPLRLND